VSVPERIRFVAEGDDPVAVRYPREQMHRITYTKLTPAVENVCVRRDGMWTIQRSTYRSL
jgi:hypothetical protein